MLKNKVLTWLNLTIMAIYTIPVTYSYGLLVFLTNIQKLNTTLHKLGYLHGCGLQERKLHL